MSSVGIIRVRSATPWLVVAALSLVTAGMLAGCTSNVSDTAVTTTAPPPTSASPIETPPYVLANQLSGHTLTYLTITGATAGSVDISGMSVDLDCARSWTWTTGETLRVQLLEEGCAVLTTRTPAKDELTAQQQAQAAHLGRWASGPQTSNRSSGSHWFTNLLSWAVRNWYSGLGFLIAVLGLSWVARAIDRFRTRGLRWTVEVVLAGPASVGKTGVWHALSRKVAPKPSGPSVGVAKAVAPSPEPYGRYMLQPVYIDTAGSKPGDALDELQKAPRRHKRVLIVVAAPCRQDIRPQGSVFDDNFVAEQRGYLSLPIALVGQADPRLKPDLVVLFLTKFDLLSDHSPEDAASKTAKAEMDDHFREHASRLEAQCDAADVAFLSIIGSGQKKWGISELRDGINDMLAERNENRVEVPA